MKKLLLVFVVVFFGTTQAFIWNWFIPRVRVCLRAGGDALVLQSGCIMCDRSSFPTIMESCVDVPYLPENVTTEQGVCISRSCAQEGTSNGNGLFNFFGNAGAGANGLFGSGGAGFFGRKRREAQSGQLSPYRQPDVQDARPWIIPVYYSSVLPPSPAEVDSQLPSRKAKLDFITQERK